MKNELQLFKNEMFEITVKSEDGEILFDVEAVARSLGLIGVSTKSGGKQYEWIRWDRINEHLSKYLLKEVVKGDYIPESAVYKLAFKANNEIAEKFQDWLAIEVLPKLRKTGKYEIPKQNDSKVNRNQIMLMNAKTRMANTYLKLANVDTLSSEYKNILVSKASQILSGEDIIPLPKSTQRTYSAKEIGDMFNVSANKVGRIANENNLKTKEYGEYYRDKSKYSNKEVDTWVYFDTIIPVIAKLLGVEVA